MQMLRGDRCCDEKGDRYAFALMGWQLLDLGDRLQVSRSDRLLQQFSHCSEAVNTVMSVFILGGGRSLL